MPKTQTVAKVQRHGAAAPLSQRIDEAVTNAVISGKALTAVALADALLEENEDLFREYAVTLIVRKRRKLERKKQLSLFPDFEAQYTHVPKRLPMRDGKRLPRLKATYRQAREFLWSLKAREKKDPLRLELQGLLKIMRPYAQKQPGITYEEVARLESEKHGWKIEEKRND